MEKFSASGFKTCGIPLKNAERARGGRETRIGKGAEGGDAKWAEGG